MIMKRVDGEIVLSPRAVGLFVGGVVMSMILGLSSFVKVLSVNDTDRYTGAEARRDLHDTQRDLTIMRARLMTLEAQVETHGDLDWHGQAGNELASLRAQIENIRNEHRWLRGTGPEQ